VPSISPAHPLTHSPSHPLTTLSSTIDSGATNCGPMVNAAWRSSTTAWAARAHPRRGWCRAARRRGPASPPLPPASHPRAGRPDRPCAAARRPAPRWPAPRAAHRCAARSRPTGAATARLAPAPGAAVIRVVHLAAVAALRHDKGAEASPARAAADHLLHPRPGRGQVGHGIGDEQHLTRHRLDQFLEVGRALAVQRGDGLLPPPARCRPPAPAAAPSG
jgi:hypothetical protein